MVTHTRKQCLSPLKLAEARSRLKAHLNKKPVPSTRFDVSPPPVDPSLDSQLNRDKEWVDEQAQWVDEQAPRIAPDPPPPPANAVSCRWVADSWEELLLRLEGSYADYYRSTHAQQRPVAPALVEHECTVGCTKQIKKVVKCLYLLYVLNVQIVTCECALPVGAGGDAGIGARYDLHTLRCTLCDLPPAGRQNDVAEQALLSSALVVAVGLEDEDEDMEPAATSAAPSATFAAPSAAPTSAPLAAASLLPAPDTAPLTLGRAHRTL
ncbi:hypothetical protein MVEN_00658200 [Mycena venus]|uniref:Uncharacterized protein n=1 Tax=Mycena venus TaxID=2733690 RepID=A0A8H6YL03_9AGAR|nr:hypothetical protein MVEN_00658200 [Mycena venus]